MSDVSTLTPGVESPPAEGQQPGEGSTPLDSTPQTTPVAPPPVEGGDEDVVPEGVDPVEFYRQKFEGLKASVGRQGNELGELRRFRDDTLAQQQVAQQPVPVQTPAAPVDPRQAAYQEVYDAIYQDKLAELVQQGYQDEDVATQAIATQRAQRDFSLRQRMIQAELAPVQGILRQTVEKQALANAVHMVVPQLPAGVTKEDVAASLNVPLEYWQRMAPDQQKEAATHIAKSLAYDRMHQRTPATVPSPANPPVPTMTPGSPARSAVPAQYEVAVQELLALNANVSGYTREMAEGAVRRHFKLS